MVYAVYLVKTMGFTCLREIPTEKREAGRRTHNKVNVHASGLLRFQPVHFCLAYTNTKQFKRKNIFWKFVR